MLLQSLFWQESRCFFNRRGVFIIDMFSYAVVDEACRATNILLIAAVTEFADLLFWYFILETILKRFWRRLSRDTPSLELCILLTITPIAFIHTSHLLHISPYTFFAYIQRARNIFSSLMMPLIGESLDFSFYFLNSSSRPHQNSFIQFLLY